MNKQASVNNNYNKISFILLMGPYSPPCTWRPSDYWLRMPQVLQYA